MAIKNAIYQVDNGTDFDEIHFKTNSKNVYMSNGLTVEDCVVSLQNEIGTNKSTLQTNINAIREVL